MQSAITIIGNACTGGVKNLAVLSRIEYIGLVCSHQIAKLVHYNYCKCMKYFNVLLTYELATLGIYSLEPCPAFLAILQHSTPIPHMCSEVKV